MSKLSGDSGRQYFEAILCMLKQMKCTRRYKKEGKRKGQELEERKRWKEKRTRTGKKERTRRDEKRTRT